MKVARTDRWYKWTYSHLPTPIQQFITAHNIPQEEVLAVLSAHYENDVPRLHPEVILDTSNQVASGSYYGHGQSSSSSDQPMEPACDAPIVVPPQPAVLPIDTDQAPVMGACLLRTIKPIVVPQQPSALPIDTDHGPFLAISPGDDTSKVRRVSMTSPHQGNAHHGVHGPHPNASPPPQLPIPPDWLEVPKG